MDAEAIRSRAYVCNWRVAWNINERRILEYPSTPLSEGEKKVVIYTRLFRIPQTILALLCNY